MDFKRLEKDLKMVHQTNKVLCDFFRPRVLDFYRNQDTGTDTTPLEKLCRSIQDDLDAHQIAFKVNKPSMAVYLSRNKKRIAPKHTEPMKPTPNLFTAPLPSQQLQVPPVAPAADNKDPFEGLVPPNIQKDLK